jgi:hypothetical protein
MHVTKLTIKIFLGLQEIGQSILQLLFFLAKKVAKKAKTAESYPRTRPVPTRSAVIPPHLKHMEFSFIVENFGISRGRSTMRMHM